MTDTLSDVVREMFTPHGPLARSTAFFQPRPGQTEMAVAVAQTLEKGGSLVVEAGTGVGKTFAYLVPALLSGERVLVSTASKTLQDQLFARDIPDVIQALGLPVKLAMLKGRGSYLCQQRLELTLQAGTLPDRPSVKALASVKQWATTTLTGDLAEVPALDERSPLIPLITSNRDNCLGSSCPHWRDCHVNLARRDAMAADVVVINHHLFFADMAVRESGMAELLPTVRVVIFDEAHQLNETGIQFLGKQLGSAQMLDLARDVLTTGLQLARGLVDWQTLTASFEKSIRDWRLVVGKQPANAKLRWAQSQPQGVDEQDWTQALQDVNQAALVLQAAIENVIDAAPDFQRLHERLSDVVSLIDYFSHACAHGSVRWVDVNAHIRCMEVPLDIADVVQNKLLDSEVVTVPGTHSEPVSLPRSWIFTSATLGSDPQLTWFTEPCGLKNARWPPRAAGKRHRPRAG